MRLPNRQSWEAEEEMLSNSPFLVVVLEVKSHCTTIYIFEILSGGLCRVEAESYTSQYESGS